MQDEFSQPEDDYQDEIAGDEPAKMSEADFERLLGRVPPENTEPSRVESVRCAKCGTTWDRLKEDGRAGCAQCYVAFAQELANVMERVQKASQHAGKTPRAMQKRQMRLVHLRQRRDNRLEMLQRRLKESLERENYEEAAKLRDKIKVVASTIIDDK